LVTHDHESDGSSSFDQNTDLTPDFSREVTEKTGQFRGNYLLRRNSPSVNVFQSSQLVRFQTDDVSIDPSDRYSPLSGPKMYSPLRKLDLRTGPLDLFSSDVGKRLYPFEMLGPKARIVSVCSDVLEGDRFLMDG